MATFYVGQAVRCVHPWSGCGSVPSWREIAGREAVVVGFGVNQHPRKLGQPRVDVSVKGEVYWMPPYGLEPIIPEGMESVEESLALWQPEGVAA